MKTMTAQKEQNQVRITKNDLVVFLTLIASVSKAGDWCEAKNPLKVSEAILTAARDGVDPVKIPDASIDSRVLVKNLGMVCKNQQMVNGLTKIAKATVSLSDFNFKSGRGVMTTSSGIVMETKQCPGQYVLTVRHATDKMVLVEGKNGQKELVKSLDDPKDATLTVTSGLVDGKIVKSNGKVIAVGKRAKMSMQGWALIKLSKGLPDRANIGYARPDEYSKDLVLSSIGQSFDLGDKSSKGVGNGLLSVDPNCFARSVNSTGEYVSSDCWSASGASGGPLSANASTDSNVVDLVVVGLNEGSASSSGPTNRNFKSENVDIGETSFLNLNAVREKVYESLREDYLANGCN